MRSHLTKAITLILFFLSTLSIDAQRLGLEGGLNSSNMAVDAALEEIFDFTPKINFQIGLWGELPIGESWGIRPSLLFMRKGTQDQSTSNLGPVININYDYLDIPLLVYLEQGRVQFRLGGSVGIPLDRFLYDTESDRRLEGSAVENIWDTGVNFSLMGGLALQFQKFHVSLQYQHGITATLQDFVFTDANGDPIQEVNTGEHRNILLSIGYSLWGK
ncbi:MAG: PorT family protein [Cyanothece sp. SIO1E1]|nr:PorT family protein [Cyanothece sp. SIO1E1]